MTDEKLTTVQIDVETRDKLKVLAKAFERTQAGQLRWMVNVEFEKCDKVKLLPATTPTKKNKTLPKVIEQRRGG